MKNVVCNLCGQDDWDVLFPSTMPQHNTEGPDVSAFRCTSSGYGNHAQIVQCKKCSYVYANPVWEESDLIHLYSEVEDETYVTEKIGRQLTFAKHLKDFERVAGPGNGRALLDVGAYIGVFVDVARQAGWDAIGVEPSDWAVQYAKKQDLPVIQGTQDAPELHGRQFDALTMWDVIEHVSDPSGELAKAFNLLKPGGYIAVHTMDIDSLMAKVAGGRWPWLMTMHIHYFSQATLCRMLEKVGFEIVWSGAQGRYIRLNYLSSRLGGLNHQLGKVFDQTIHALNIADKPVPINFGDLFTVYAKKPTDI